MLLLVMNGVILGKTYIIFQYILYFVSVFSIQIDAQRENIEKTVSLRYFSNTVTTEHFQGDLPGFLNWKYHKTRICVFSSKSHTEPKLPKGMPL